MIGNIDEPTGVNTRKACQFFDKFGGVVKSWVKPRRGFLSATNLIDRGVA